MADGPSRKELVSIAFQGVWMVFWLAAIIVAAYVFGGTARDGEIVPALFLLVWVAGAAFGLYSAARGLHARLMGGGRVRRGGAPGTWSDGYSDRQDP